MARPPSSDRGEKRSRPGLSPRNKPTSRPRTAKSKSEKEKRTKFEDEELGGSDSSNEENSEISEESEDDDETPAQKRLRLSKMYLESLEKEKEKNRGDDMTFDAAEVDRDLIAERLQKDVLEHNGRMHVLIASKLNLEAKIYVTPSKTHRGALTAAVASESGEFLFTSSKDGSIIKWNLPLKSSDTDRITQAEYLPKRLSNSQLRKFDPSVDANTSTGHSSEVLSLDVSSDGTTLVSGGRDKLVGVWKIEQEKTRWVRALGGHKDAVSDVSFRMNSFQVYTSSLDRTIKSFNASTLAYHETLFGHQDVIPSISSLRGELIVSAGSRDKTVRYWKVADETQLVFRGGMVSKSRKVLDGGLDEDEEHTEKKKFIEGTIESVAMIDDSTFVSGGDSGSICLWTTTRKKPIFTHPLAHGINEFVSETEGIISTARSITSLSSLPYGDVFASGSWDGQVKLWKTDSKLKSFSLLTTIPVAGIISTLQVFSPSLKTKKGKIESEKEEEKRVVVVIGRSKEPRLGRWMKIKEGKEGAVVAVYNQS